MMTAEEQDARSFAAKTEVALLELKTRVWIANLAPWEVIMHGTFVKEFGCWTAKRCFERFMERNYRHVGYFYALERNPSRDGFHVHALWTGTESVRRTEAWAKWFQFFGRNRIEPVRSKDDSINYASKYVTKDVYKGGWWDVKLPCLKGL